ncbi:MAG: hypothetical protein FWD57_10860, partial [Polyangiaceae bacterium]|nr:hypothetical protein [Polyangiaceae bacterium]
FFEKALRYSPRSAEASSGLARAFLALGDGKRGVALLSRAAELAGSGKSTETPTPAVLIELATALAEHAVDLPTAIHYARTVPFGLPETIQARTLEGRWRHQLNDIVGASHAFALAREAASILPIQTVDIYRESLLEAAEFELDIRHDPKSAKQHAELALRACPTDPTAKRIFRRAAQSEIDSCQCKRPYSIEDPISETYQPQFESEPGGLEETEIPSDDESTIDSLTSRIRGNPNDHAAVSQLCTILERTDRLRDLLALVSGCLEESPPPAVRKDLIACRMRTLEKLIRDCRRAGRSDEAELYEMSLNEQE